MDAHCTYHGHHSMKLSACCTPSTCTVLLAVTCVSVRLVMCQDKPWSCARSPLGGHIPLLLYDDVILYKFILLQRILSFLQQSSHLPLAALDSVESTNKNAPNCSETSFIWADFQRSVTSHPLHSYMFSVSHLFSLPSWSQRQVHPPPYEQHTFRGAYSYPSLPAWPFLINYHPLPQVPPYLPPVCPLPTNWHMHVLLISKSSSFLFFLWLTLFKGCSTLNTIPSDHQEWSEKASRRE